jgi:hypothetical protein
MLLTGQPEVQIASPRPTPVSAAARASGTPMYKFNVSLSLCSLGANPRARTIYIGGRL